MNILINASVLSEGGGLQVADSICRELGKFPQHQFVVVLSHKLQATADAISQIQNVSVYMYTLSWEGNSLWKKLNLLLRGRIPVLDSLVADHKIDIVLTIFGPSIWKPRCKHVCGFARAHFVLRDSPFYAHQNFLRRIRTSIRHSIYRYAFGSPSKVFYTESPYISQKLSKWIHKVKVYTVTNYYNNIFDTPKCWDNSISLPPFDGYTMLTVSANYSHKNLSIIPSVIKEFQRKYPKCNVRFVLTLRPEELECDDATRSHIVFLGRVKMSQVPHLYAQSEAMFLPTLLECFSASYAEAFRMKKPVLTSDLEFARSLCGDAAIYFNPMFAEDIADAIYSLSSDKQMAEDLVKKGEQRLLTFDNYEKRAQKLIKILEQQVESK